MTPAAAAQCHPHPHDFDKPYHADLVLAPHPRTAAAAPDDEYRLGATSVDFVAGSVSGVASVAVGHPFDTLKIRLQMSTSSSAFTGAWDCAQQTMAKEGWTGLYRGMVSPMSTVPVINAVVFSSYGFAKDVMQSTEPQEILTTRQAMAAGAFTGLCNTVIVTPVELIKCRLQAQGRALTSVVVSPSSSSSVIQYRGTIDCIQHILHLEGTHHRRQGFL